LIEFKWNVKQNEYKTPSAPGFFVVRPAEEEKVDAGTQKWFQSNIGCLFYLVKLSWPDIANSYCELSNVIDGAAPAQVKELKRLIQFVQNTKEKGLHMKILDKNAERPKHTATATILETWSKGKASQGW
jgi:hypothetical protein